MALHKLCVVHVTWSPSTKMMFSSSDFTVVGNISKHRHHFFFFLIIGTPLSKIRRPTGLIWCQKN